MAKPAKSGRASSSPLLNSAIRRSCWPVPKLSIWDQSRLLETRTPLRVNTSGMMAPRDASSCTESNAVWGAKRLCPLMSAVRVDGGVFCSCGFGASNAPIADSAMPMTRLMMNRVTGSFLTSGTSS